MKIRKPLLDLEHLDAIQQIRFVRLGHVGIRAHAIRR